MWGPRPHSLSERSLVVPNGSKCSIAVPIPSFKPEPVDQDDNQDLPAPAGYVLCTLTLTPDPYTTL